jgi:hypothetical protein
MLNRFIPLLLTVFLALISYSMPTVRRAVADGDWDDPSIWSPAGIPDCTNDFIYIDIGVTVSFTSNQDLEGCGSKIELIIYGVLDFTTNGRRLRLPANSELRVAPGGLLTKSTPGGGSSTLISIDGVNEWRAGDGDLPSGSNLDYNWFGDPLPVELLNFSVSFVEDYNKIEWSTASESNNDYFIVETSKDGYYWEVIDRIDGAGNSSTRIDYSIIHKGFNDSGLNYYRLTQVDYNGDFKAFPVISIQNKSFKNSFEVYNLMGQRVGKSYKGIVIKVFSDGLKVKFWQEPSFSSAD